MEEKYKKKILAVKQKKPEGKPNCWREDKSNS
jgi:hypothetical protein